MQLTTNQQRVLAALVKARSPLTAYALLDQLRGAGFSAPTQVYRALEKLVERGLVHRLETLNAYVPCTHPNGCNRRFKVFAICDICGHVDEFVDSAVSCSLKRWMGDNAFSLDDSMIEIHGRCSACMDLQTSRG